MNQESKLTILERENNLLGLVSQNHQLRNQLIIGLHLLQFPLNILLGNELFVPLATLDTLEGKEHSRWFFLQINFHFFENV